MRKAFQFISGLVLVTFLFVWPLSAQESNGVSVTDPAVIVATAPEFPPIARSAHGKGDVVVEVTIASDGVVETSKSLSGHPLLQKAAETAAKKWKFALANDRSRKVRLVFSFGYIDGNKSDPEYMIIFMPPYKVEVIMNSSRVRLDY
jgi:TonB family protein